jgi:hypothetical protein
MVGFMDVDIFDKRITDRLMRQGKVTRDQFASYLAALPDKGDNVMELESDEELLKGAFRDLKLRHAAEEEEDLED